MEIPRIPRVLLRSSAEKAGTRGWVLWLCLRLHLRASMEEEMVEGGGRRATEARAKRRQACLPEVIVVEGVQRKDDPD